MLAAMARSSFVEEVGRAVDGHEWPQVVHEHSLLDLIFFYFSRLGVNHIQL
jgi:hypothetical protein